jgi:hypothetical protein
MHHLGSRSPGSTKGRTRQVRDRRAVLQAALGGNEVVSSKHAPLQALSAKAGALGTEAAFRTSIELMYRIGRGGEAIRRLLLIRR